MLSPHTKRSKITNNPERSGLLLLDEVLKLSREVETAQEEFRKEIAKVHREIESIKDKDADKYAELLEKIDSIKIDFKEKINELQQNLPDLDKVLQSIKGRDGTKGEKGEKGVKGDRGISGLKGERGDSIIGPRGERGAAGERGLPGRDGEDGKNGKDGKDGTSRYGGGGGTINGVTYYDISASLNGSTRRFWIPTNMGIIAAIGSSFPFIFRPTVDYVQDGHDILFDNAVDPAVSLAGG